MNKILCYIEKMKKSEKAIITSYLDFFCFFENDKKRVHIKSNKNETKEKIL